MSPTLHSLTCDIILTVNSATKSFLSQKEKKKNAKNFKNDRLFKLFVSLIVVFKLRLGKVKARKKMKKKNLPMRAQRNNLRRLFKGIDCERDKYVI